MSGVDDETLAQAVLTSRRLDVWVEVRDADTNEPLYSFCAAANARVGDEVAVKHQIGVQVSGA